MDAARDYRRSRQDVNAAIFGLQRSSPPCFVPRLRIYLVRGLVRSPSFRTLTHLCWMFRAMHIPADRKRHSVSLRSVQPCTERAHPHPSILTRARFTLPGYIRHYSHL